MTIAHTLEERQVTVGKDVMSYYDNGVGDGVLLFIHGSFLTKDYWQKQLYHFGSGHRVIAVDLVGHGKSSAHRDAYTIDRYGHDIFKLIEELDLQNVILVGHSIGADIMLAVNALSGDRIIGLIGVDYFHEVGDGLPEDMIQQIMTDLRNNFAFTNADYARNTLLTPQTDHMISERVLADFRSADPNVGISMNEDFFHYTKKEVDLLKSLDNKLYLVNSNYQPTNTAKLKKILGDQYELKLIEGTCHFPMLEKPVDLNRVIENYLEEIIG